MPNFQAPNMQGHIEDLTRIYTDAWQLCKTSEDHGEFIKLVAINLYNNFGPRWGLNAKRDGNAYDISLDCIAFYLGPTDRHVEVIDIITNHTWPHATIGWLNITNFDTMGQPGTARFVNPMDFGGYNGPPINNGPLIMTVAEAINKLSAAGISVTDPVVNRARELGWGGGDTILESIVNQLIQEFAPIPSNKIETAVIRSGVAGISTGMKLIITVD